MGGCWIACRQSSIVLRFLMPQRPASSSFELPRDLLHNLRDIRLTIVNIWRVGRSNGEGSFNEVWEISKCCGVLLWLSELAMVKSHDIWYLIFDSSSVFTSTIYALCEY